MTDVFPRRNLPDRAEEWGRTVERRIDAASKAWKNTGLLAAGDSRASSASLESLAQNLESLQEFSSHLPYTSTASAASSGWGLAAGWNTVASLSLPDGGKSSRNIVAYATTAVFDSGIGGGGGVSLVFPFDLSLVTSEYGPRSGGFHEGTDFAGGAASSGNPIPASGAGVVTQKTFSSGFGNYIIIYHGVSQSGVWDLYTLYAHMNSPSPLNVGNSVSQGQTVGFVGNTGNSFGAHLHFETHRVPVGGSIVWDNNNPTYDSNRTAIDSREFIPAFGTPTPPSYDPYLVTRLVIDGVISREFLPYRNSFVTPIPNHFYPVFGRTYSGSGAVSVQLQAYSSQGVPAVGQSMAHLSAEGIFTS